MNDEPVTMVRNVDGARFHIVTQALSIDGPMQLRGVDPPHEVVDTTKERVCIEFTDSRDLASGAVKIRRLNEPAPARYSYGSDSAGGIHLSVDDAPLLRLSRADLVAMLAEADRAPTTGNAP